MMQNKFLLEIAI